MITPARGPVITFGCTVCDPDSQWRISTGYDEPQWTELENISLSNRDAMLKTDGAVDDDGYGWIVLGGRRLCEPQLPLPIELSRGG